MRIVISGASGFIGTALTERLLSKGHDIVRLVRRPPTGTGEAQWGPGAGQLDEAVLDGADAVVNLSGAGIGDRRWTKARVQEIIDSRLRSTKTLTAAMGRLGTPPGTFLSQSASGYYGSSRAGMLREEAGPGKGMLATLCVDWEAAARTAPAGVRVVTPRTGVVLSPDGGALGPLLPLLKLGVGGPLGNGRQYWPWISLVDEVSAFEYLLDSPLEGPVNVCAPESADVNAIVAQLAAALHRPAFLRVPAPALRLVLGGHLAEELVLANQRMEPAKLMAAGFDWQHPALADAARWVASGGN
ncbi:TIGR01777 family oxidoreductase [Arthrobacter sp. MMS18-M83]|uniref:TIGR01777 family oxidoreductase n=1 Tax=Arthrobacter sp. MMS18-M83 TaxID=2996261 RepID=UPI00227A0A7A|nr:TIGR01777 family oxidoreductase [Arthrobacter sp. MMS18-M83]WAH97884.1 TIGR01777 family oxidoreductase [Arthrobacter sp. MMS18-M83]